MDYLPIFAAVRDRGCLVVGGGSVAQRKVELLLSAGAQVHVVALEVCSGLAALVSESAGARASQRGYQASDLTGALLVVAATNQQAINARVARDAAARGLLVNVVDDRVLSSFIVPSIVDRSPLVAAVSSSGASPVLARVVRGQLERMLSPAHGELARFAQRHRDRVRERFPTLAARRAFWEQCLDGPVGELVLAARLADAELAFSNALSQPASAVGQVSLIDARDGVPDLLTLRAARHLGRADLVLYGQGVEAVLPLARRDAAREPLGSQADSCDDALLARVVALSQRGERVCLLRHGAPYGEGRSTDAAELTRHGVIVHLVSGPA